MNNRMISKIIYAAATLMSLAGCSQEVMLDGNTLPDGAYPLQILSVSVNAEDGEQQTRVAESADGMGSAWMNGDKIGVRIGDGTPGTYVLNADGSINADDSRPAYWATTTSNQAINAWFPTDATVSLADQSNGLAYVLKAEPVTADYNTSVSLNFTHQLAKVRVIFKGDADLTDAEVYVKGSTTCTNDQGTVSGSNDGWVRMYFTKYNDGTVCYEANLVPGTLSKSQAFKLIKDGKEQTMDLYSDMGLTAGKLNIATLIINKSGGHSGTRLDQQEEGQLYGVDKNCIFYGDGKEHNMAFYLDEGVCVTLKDVKLNTQDYYSLICRGNNTIVLEGENTLTTSSGFAPIVVLNGTLTINGTNADKLTLTGAEGTESGTLGVVNGSNLIINGGHIIANGSKTESAGIGSCPIRFAQYSNGAGNITINGGVIEAFGGNSAAGIGSGNQDNCGNITITGGNITATGGGGYSGAGIGSGAGLDGTSPKGTCGDITISGKNTVVKATAGTPDNPEESPSDDIGVGSLGQCGTVTIKDGASVTATHGRIHGH